ISAGIRWAETTSAAAGTPNSSSTSTAACMTGQSESLPMTTPTTGTRPCPAPARVPASAARPASAAPLVKPSDGMLIGLPPERSRLLASGGQVARRPGGPVPDRGHVVAERGHVAYLAAGSDRLAVELDLEGGVGGQDVTELAAQVRVVGAEHVRQRDTRRRERGGAERQVQHRSQMLLELRGPGSVDGPVPAVVRPHGQFVHQQAAAGLEKLHGQQPDDVQVPREKQTQPDGFLRNVVGQDGSRREHLMADAVPLNGLDNRVGGAVTGRRTSDQNGQLALERNELLGEQRHPVRHYLVYVVVAAAPTHTASPVPA